MPTATLDDDQDEVLDVGDTDTATDKADEPEDNGNTPDTPEQIAAANDARAKAIKQLAADEDDDEPKGQRIPKARFDEVNEERKALAKQLAEMAAEMAALTGKKAEPEPEKPKEPEFDLKAAMRERLQALATGDDDKALELDEKIQEHTLKIATERARREFESTQAQIM